ncbi:MAG: acetyl-CoA carboxylase carboxyltransferase subunit alpha [Candidatus Ratteibacteria bacterium]|nr:acetyl-CoA carboxylase carboxyltransferase subunit alpha [Candidatus Ratteibacteria bacterium]
MQRSGLDFEKPIVELEKKIEELKRISSKEHLNIQQEIVQLEERAGKLKRDIFSNLNAWQRTQLARLTERPSTLEYMKLMMDDFIELHGDRLFFDDEAVVAGIGKLAGHSVVIVGHQKGKNTKENVRRNFGMPHPEGYRKALRLIKTAEKFSFPLVTLIDTPGAYPGIGAEERGQAEAIARNLMEMSRLFTPIIAVIIGEGGSGGALGIGVGDRVLMLENSIYSVISPEGCAAILWKDRKKAELAAEAMKLTSFDLLRLGIIDEIIPEPLGGAHRAKEEAADILKEVLLRYLEELKELSIDELLKSRYGKYRKFGVFKEKGDES